MESYFNKRERDKWEFLITDTIYLGNCYYVLNTYKHRINIFECIHYYLFADISIIAENLE